MFLLDLQSKDPIYQQIQDQLRRFIDAGVLKPGDRLPSVRQCAQDNGINPNTVAKAYGELEKAGYVHNFVKKGVYVADVKSSAPDPKTESVIRSLWESGVTREEIEKAIMRVYDGAEGRITEIKSETVPETVNESGRNAELKLRVSRRQQRGGTRNAKNREPVKIVRNKPGFEWGEFTGE